MGDELICPRCGGYLKKAYRCVCGWKLDKEPKKVDNGRKFCVEKNSDGSPCKNIPAMTIGRSWFCRYHHDQKMGRHIARVDPKIVEEALGKIYTLLGKRPPPRKASERRVA